MAKVLQRGEYGKLQDNPGDKIQSRKTPYLLSNIVSIRPIGNQILFMRLDPLWHIGLLEPGQEGGAIGLRGLDDGVDEEGDEGVGGRMEHPDLGFFPKVLSEQVACALCEEEFDCRDLCYFE